MNLRLLLGGAKSFLPFRWDYRGTGGTTSADYCYSVWFRHLRLLHENGLSTKPPVLVELGPGDSLGVGLLALLLGTERYYALDVVAHADPERNVRILESLIEMLRAKAAIPGDDQLPLLFPRLRDYSFPADIVTPQRLDAGLSEQNIRELRAATESLRTSNASARVQYICPWMNETVVPPGTADMVFSQGTLQDMDQLDAAFVAMHRWLKPGGVMTHHVDFSSADKSLPWNHHWTYSELEWKIIRGRRPYYINGLPLSAYLRLFDAHGFEMVKVSATPGEGSVPRARLARRYRDVTDQDLATRAAHFLAIKR